MIDRDIEKLMRHLKTDPHDTQAQLEFAQARARVEGSEIYLEPLNDRLIWNECSEPLQDLAINEVRERLEPDYEWLETRVYSCVGLSHRIASFTHLKSGLVLNLLPGGAYTMGDNEGEREFEKAAHPVKIRPILMGRFLVTQACWDKVGGPYTEPLFIGPDRPVDSVSWDTAHAWLEMAGGSLRLPSESEWEYACRAGTKSRYFWGDEMDDSYCWHNNNSLRHTFAGEEHERHPNAFGLIDMSGHLWEWCQDGWVEGYGNGPTNNEPRGGSSSLHVFRGGSYAFEAERCGSARRQAMPKLSGHRYLGLRVARGLDW